MFIFSVYSYLFFLFHFSNSFCLTLKHYVTEIPNINTFKKLRDIIFIHEKPRGRKGRRQRDVIQFESLTIHTMKEEIFGLMVVSKWNLDNIAETTSMLLISLKYHQLPPFRPFYVWIIAVYHHVFSITSLNHV